jgi:hypothetical protein
MKYYLNWPACNFSIYLFAVISSDVLMCANVHTAVKQR